MRVQKSGHMPVREGKMECTTCHSPHGSTNVRMLKTGNTLNELCASCHAEKRGPFLWDHAAGRENCATCHDPHGSNNDRMLVAKDPMLCQRCHVASRHPATIYDGNQIAAASNRAIGRSCVNCHSQIHGTNHPAGDKFLR
jgi:DmsE family decaheme c-type cytochrome